ncbi:FabA/FabZ family ACP-dehydratase [Micromonospora sediminicola]|uniref:FabA/FabZ family ACP-dehydratase n=1 Tax=Micromonospora sediminicola TaxID=946078 RepID=UPI0033CA8434
MDTWTAQSDGSTLTLAARLLVPADNPHLRGHFPGMPVLPGVFVIESLCQLLALACAHPGQQPPALRTVRSLRFFAPFLGGDELLLRAHGTQTPAKHWSVKAQAYRHETVLAARLHAELGLEGFDA